jgi:hypothetical protein
LPVSKRLAAFCRLPAEQDGFELFVPLRISAARVGPSPYAETTWRAQGEFLRGGTNGSNPSPSSGESVANRFLPRGSRTAEEDQLARHDRGFSDTVLRPGFSVGTAVSNPHSRRRQLLHRTHVCVQAPRCFIIARSQGESFGRGSPSEADIIFLDHLHMLSGND